MSKEGMFTFNGVQIGCYNVTPKVEFVAREAMVLASDRTRPRRRFPAKNSQKRLVL